MEPTILIIYHTICIKISIILMHCKLVQIKQMYVHNMKFSSFKKYFSILRRISHRFSGFVAPDIYRSYEGFKLNEFDRYLATCPSYSDASERYLSS